MLSASGATPKHLPIPSNWQGVSINLSKAAVLMGENQFPEARLILQEILEFAPMEAKAWHMLGKALQHLGRHKKALRCFKAAASCYHGEDMNDELPASPQLAKLLWQQGDQEQAKCMIEMLLAENPRDAELQALEVECCT